MKTESIVPRPAAIYTGLTFNGRLIGDYVRDGSYWKWHWSCVVHGTESERPMRMKDILNRKGPRCCYSRAGKSNTNWSGYEDIPLTYINQVRNSAAARGHEHTITPEDMWDQWLTQKGLCVYTKRKLTLGLDASLDRRDSALGYIPTNIQWLHKDVNLCKQGLSEDEFLKLCHEVVDNT